MGMEAGMGMETGTGTRTGMTTIPVPATGTNANGNGNGNGNSPSVAQPTAPVQTTTPVQVTTPVETTTPVQSSRQRQRAGERKRRWRWRWRWPWQRRERERLVRAEARRQRRSARERLIDDAVALGQLLQRRKLLVVGVGVELERQADLAEADRRLTIDAERAAEVEVALRAHASRRDGDPERGRDRAQRHPGARDQRLEQHVARAQQRAVATGRRVEPGLGERPARVHRAGDAVAQVTRRGQRDQRSLGLGPVALLERRLQRPQLIAIHARDLRTTSSDGRAGGRRHGRGRGRLRLRLRLRRDGGPAVVARIVRGADPFDDSTIDDHEVRPRGLAHTPVAGAAAETRTPDQAEQRVDIATALVGRHQLRAARKRCVGGFRVGEIRNRDHHRAAAGIRPVDHQARDREVPGGTADIPVPKRGRPVSDHGHGHRARLDAGRAGSRNRRIAGPVVRQRRQGRDGLRRRPPGVT